MTAHTAHGWGAAQATPVSRYRTKTGVRVGWGRLSSQWTSYGILCFSPRHSGKHLESVFHVDKWFQTVGRKNTSIDTGYFLQSLARVCFKWIH